MCAHTVHIYNPFDASKSFVFLRQGFLTLVQAALTYLFSQLSLQPTADYMDWVCSVHQNLEDTTSDVGGM